jgi:hypothetical protein
MFLIPDSIHIMLQAVHVGNHCCNIPYNIHVQFNAAAQLQEKMQNDRGMRARAWANYLERNGSDFYSGGTGIISRPQRCPSSFENFLCCSSQSF